MPPRRDRSPVTAAGSSAPRPCSSRSTSVRTGPGSSSAGAWCRATPTDPTCGLVPTVGGRPRRLTIGTVRDTVPRISPDGTTVAFVRAPAPQPGGEGKADRAEAWIVPLAGGRARRIARLKDDVEAVSWSPDGRSLAFLAAAGERQVRGRPATTRRGAGRTPHHPNRLARRRQRPLGTARAPVGDRNRARRRPASAHRRATSTSPIRHGHRTGDGSPLTPTVSPTGTSTTDIGSFGPGGRRPGDRAGQPERRRPRAVVLAGREVAGLPGHDVEDPTVARPGPHLARHRERWAAALPDARPR